MQGECGPKWVIYFLGNGGRYEEAYAEMETYAKELGTAVRYSGFARMLETIHTG